MSGRNRYLVIAILSLVTVGACSPDSPDIGSAQQGTAVLKDPANVTGTQLQNQAEEFLDLHNVNWVLVEIGGQPLLVDSTNRPTIEFSEAGFSGFSGCNRFTGQYEIEGSTIRFGNAAVTRMACATGMELETSFLAMLSGELEARVEGNSLLLADDAGVVVAAFDQAN